MSTSEVHLDSAKALLLDTRLRERRGSGLVETVDSLREDGYSWRTTAAEIAEATDVPITGQTLRVWMRERNGAAA